MDETKLQSLLEEAISHCYDDEEEFWAMYSALVGRVSYPLQANLSGQGVTVVGLHEPSSDLVKGVMARVDKGGQEEMVPLADLEIVDPDPASAQWLAIYPYWLKKKGRV